VAPPAGTLRVGRYFGALVGLFAVLYAIVFWPNQPKTPKLGLDLQGGAQVILKANSPDGKTPSKSAMNQAREIITNRVNGLGVSSAEVVIQGGDRIIVSIPGKGVEDLEGVARAAQLQFRPAIAQPIPIQAAATPSSSASGSATPSGSTSSSGSAKPSTSLKPSTSATASPSSHGRVVPHLAGSTTPTATASPTATSSATPSKTAPANPNIQIDQWANLTVGGKPFAPPTDAAALQKLTQPQQQALATVISEWNCTNHPKDVPEKPLIACDVAHTQKYLLGPVIVKGTELKTARAAAPGTTPGQVQWEVNLSLKTTGQAQWAKYTSQHNEQSNPGDVANLVAYTLDSEVIEASTISETINGDTRMTGSFTAKSAQSLANSLKYGALPLNFTPLSNGSVSPTLGTSQLKAGMLAGGIGLALVIVYSLIYYRALGFVTIASLVVSGGMTYAMLVVLGHQIGFTLTLAGIAGFIVAVGITADSFVVFFERIKDEVHEGRSSRVAVPRAWERARRTIISADTVSLLAAVTLYYFAAGDVKGFAFTLGLSTVLDLVVVFLFTHPLVSLFSRSAAFGSARFTGLNAVRTGGIALDSADVVEAPRPAKAAKVSGKTVDRTVAKAVEKSDDTAAEPALTAAERAAARRGLRRDTSDASGKDAQS
jgi:preprotein translocase subunit SecD